MVEDEGVREVAEAQPAFARFLGVELIRYSRDLIIAELVVRPDHANRKSLLHGGAIMGFAENLRGTSASLNLPPRARTTTLESKISFLCGSTAGERARGECVPLRRGRSISVWRPRISDERDSLAAVVTEPQLVLVPPEAT